MKDVEIITIIAEQMTKKSMKVQVELFFNEKVNDDVMEAAYECIAEKYSSEFYGIEFINNKTKIYFKPKNLK